MFLCKLCRFFQTEPIALKTTFAAFGDLFQSLCHIVEPFLVKVSLEKRDRILLRNLADQMLLFFYTVQILFVRVNIRIVIKNRDLKIIR